MNPIDTGFGYLFGDGIERSCDSDFYSEPEDT